MQAAAIQRFKNEIRRHYRRHGRHELAWRRTHDPYLILVSEMMLQQTQVARVEKFYPRFMRQFPNFRALARARTATVLRAWQGMGYNRRALALRKLARVVLEKYDGRLPRERAALIALPGVGGATAGAIRAFAWNEPEIFIETNIRRAFIYFFFMKASRRRRAEKVTDEELVRYIQRTLIGEKNPREWYWALMDYGAALGAAHRSSANPNRKSVRYRQQSRFIGSARQLRGMALRILLRQARRRMELRPFLAAMGIPRSRGERIVNELVREGFMIKTKHIISISP